MDPEQKKTLEKHIRQRIKILKADIRAYERNAQPVSPDSAIGRLTRLDAMNSRRISTMALTAAKNKLVKMEQALTTIDGTDFGLCRECEEPIPMERLMIMPEADLCVACAERMKE
ncbi:MAG: TraR/DksA C4-type zinc finger protein [Desulfosarcinaceae bacterium]